eukprot:TRINITY_DN9731_c0_g1_i1.p1 TRINITY_DN9731_c0_g1~~TRINITY_DN9731_c0_g1_i1.p1  ORF type:complete len:359 (+),score=58.63 TRINITY_DN9731_c0_g1_i1:433-1509(+)
MPVDNQKVVLKLALIVLSAVCLVAGGIPQGSFLDWHADVSERSGRVLDFPTPHNNENCEGLQHMVRAMNICYIVALVSVGVLFVVQLGVLLVREETGVLSSGIYVSGLVCVVATFVVYLIMLLIFFVEFCHRKAEQEFADMGYGAGFIPTAMVLAMIAVFCLSSYGKDSNDAQQYNTLRDQYTGGPKGAAATPGAEEMQTIQGSRRGSAALSAPSQQSQRSSIPSQPSVHHHPLATPTDSDMIGQHAYSGAQRQRGNSAMPPHGAPQPAQPGAPPPRVDSSMPAPHRSRSRGHSLSQSQRMRPARAPPAGGTIRGISPPPGGVSPPRGLSKPPSVGKQPDTWARRSPSPPVVLQSGSC